MFLYLLRFCGGGKFKIGTTANLKDRICALGREKFDLERSIYFSGVPRAIKRLERQLHLDFSPSNVVCNLLPSGNSEVFDEVVWTDVIAEIDHKMERYPHLQLKKHDGIMLPKKPTNANQRTQRQAEPRTPVVPRLKSDYVGEFTQAICQHADSIKIIQDNAGEIIGLSIVSKKPLSNPPMLPRLSLYSATARDPVRKWCGHAQIISEAHSSHTGGNYYADFRFSVLESTDYLQRPLGRLKAHIVGSIRKHSKCKVEDVVAENWRHDFQQRTKSFLEQIATATERQPSILR